MLQLAKPRSTCKIRGISGTHLGGTFLNAVHIAALGFVQGQCSNAAIVDSGGSMVRRVRPREGAAGEGAGRQEFPVRGGTQITARPAGCSHWSPKGRSSARHALQGKGLLKLPTA